VKQFLGVWALLILIGSAASQSSNTAAFKLLYDQHRWFELREAIRGQTVAPVYMGAVASAFNEARPAETYLNQAIRDASSPKAVIGARETLGILYVRLGRLREAVRQFDLVLQAEPGRADVQNFRAMLGAFNAHPEYAVVSKRRASFQCAVSSRGLFIPLSINGTSLNWSLDTGFNMSGLTEAEARMLGLTVEAGGTVRDMAGSTTTARTAVARQLVIGETEFRNVPLLVLSDSAPLVSRRPPGMRGAIGLPVAVGLQAFHWTGNGRCEAGPAERDAKHGVSNLAFDGLKAVTRVRFETKDLDFVLDTGNQAGTQLWTPFARDFLALLKEQGTT
jgi:hypothetical protein